MNIPFATQGLALALAAAMAGAGVQTLRLAWLKQEVVQDREAAAETTILRERAARVDEAGMRKQSQEIQDVKDANLRRVRADLDRALDGLRDRAERPMLGASDAAPRACAGATGAELSRRDAGVLIRLAARADDIRNALDACQRREQVKIKLGGN